MLTPEEVRRERRVRLLQGPGVLDSLGDDFDSLALKCQAPVTARRPWLGTWIRNYPAYQPVSVALYGPSGALDAAGLFATRPRPVGTEVVALGHGPSDQSRIYAGDEATARDLALAIRSWLRSLPRPWRMTLAQLPDHDEAVSALEAALPRRMLQPAPGSPQVVFDEERTPGRYLSSNYRGQANNKWNRMEKHGLGPRIDLHTSVDAIAPLLPEVIEIAGIRQEELTGVRKLDDPHHAGFFREVVLEHARRGEAELMTLQIGDGLGAYALTFLDGGAARMWSSHYHPRWARYSPGHVLSRALLERCLESPGIEVLDWMKGLEPYKLRTANHVEPAWSVRAWSGLSGFLAASTWSGTRRRLTRVRERYPMLRRAQVEVRRRLGGGRRS